MRLTITYPIALFRVVLILTLVAVFLAPAMARAQDQPAAHAGHAMRPELALNYDYVLSNAPPGGCGCFNLNGGSADFAWPLSDPHFALVGDATVTHGSSSSYDLMLGAYTGGLRFTPLLGTWRLQPFGQALAGVAHASGSLVSGNQIGAANAGAAFAANLGVGLDLHVSRRFSLRLVEANYLLTTFDNGVNTRQNNLRLSAGIVYHF